MRKVAVLTLLAVLVASVGLAAAPSGASIGDKNTRFCKAVNKFSGLTNALAGGRLTKKDAATLAKALRSAAKLAPSKVKRAMTTLAKLYERIAHGENAAKVLAAKAADLIRASTTFGTYYRQQCTNVLLTTTTLG